MYKCPNCGGKIVAYYLIPEVAYIYDITSKPDEVRNKIVELFGDLPRIELFAREKVEGWASWGNEIESDVEIEGYSQKTEKYSV